jgi:hypothetical protein
MPTISTIRPVTDKSCIVWMKLHMKVIFEKLSEQIVWRMNRQVIGRTSNRCCFFRWLADVIKMIALWLHCSSRHKKETLFNPLTINQVIKIIHNLTSYHVGFQKLFCFTDISRQTCISFRIDLNIFIEGYISQRCIVGQNMNNSFPYLKLQLLMPRA